MDFSANSRNSTVTVRSIAKYMLLPGILPRLKNLGFILSKLLFVFVQILGQAGLIDPNHPCLRPENIGKYAFIEIMGMAWFNLEFKRENISQIILFFCVAGSLVLLAALALVGVLYFASHFGQEAHAQYYSSAVSSASEANVAYRPENDWALQFLERVFGPKTTTGVDFWIVGNGELPGANPWYRSLLTGMLKLYSKALLFISIIMILYLIMITLAEAARSGKPFGSKFDSVWAPIRFALALGMLVPIGGGEYNGAQMLGFQAAQWGSNLASNLWFKGIKNLNGQGAADSRNYIGASISDPGYRFVRDMFLINMCVYGYNKLLDQGKFDASIGRDRAVSTEPITSQDDTSMTYNFGISFLASDYCGSVVVPIAPIIPPTYSGNDYLPKLLANNYRQAALHFMPPNSQMNNVVSTLVAGAFQDRDQKMLEQTCPPGGLCSNQVQNWVYDYWRTALGRNSDVSLNDHFLATYKTSIDNYNKWLSSMLAKDAQYGWASAGVFYMRMSYAMSALSKVIESQPRVAKLPANFSHTFATPFEPTISDSRAMGNCNTKAGETICKKYLGAAFLSQFLRYGADFFAGAPKNRTAGANDLTFYRKAGGYTWDTSMRMNDDEKAGATDIGDIIGPIQTYLYDNFKISNSSLHPLGQVIDWGNTLMNCAYGAYATSFLLGLAGLIPGFSFATALSNFANTVGNTLIFPGFVLCFVVPLMPFLYFTFAVIEWVASIAEAVIGLPLWALSFITLRGDLAGQAVQGGKMLLEIILRPTIIIMSLISALLIFTASISFFNNSIELYMGSYGTTLSSDLVLNSGTQIAGGLGMIFVYMFSIYTLATSCFKLIDAFPNYFSRWMGLSGGGFGNYMELGASSGRIALASGVVATYIGDKAIGGVSKIATKEVGVHAYAHQDRKTHKEWMAKEEERIRKANRTAAEHNATLDEVNAIRAKMGIEALEPMAYEALPKQRNRGYFVDAVRGDMRGSFAGIKNDTYYLPPVGQQGNNQSQSNGNANNATGSGNNNGLASGAMPAATAGQNQAVTFDPAVNMATYLAKLSAGTTLGKLNKLSGISGKQHSVEDVKKALLALKLPATATPAEMKKQFSDLKNSFNPITMSKNPQFKKLSEAYKTLTDVFDLKN